MTSKAIKHKLYDYIPAADDKKVKAIHTVLANEIEEDYDHWNDKGFIEIVNKRTADFKTGKVKGVAWEEAKSNIIASVNAKVK